MIAIPRRIDLDRTSRRAISALASLALALTVVRLGAERRRQRGGSSSAARMRDAA